MSFEPHSHAALRASLIVRFLAGLLLVAASPVGAAHLRVPSTYPNVRTAISAASEGDTILIAPGTYDGDGNRQITVDGKNVVIRSEAGADLTILRIGGTSSEPRRAFVVSGDLGRATVIEGLRFEGGYHYGGAILVEDSASPTIRDCIFFGNQVIEWLPYDYGGGAIACRGSAQPRIEQSLFHQSNYPSMSGSGGAISIGESARVEILDCEFVFNHSAGAGGAVAVVDNGHARIARSTFRQNMAWTGGAFYSLSEADVAIEDCVFFQNRAIRASGALSIRQGEISGTTIARNEAGFGGGVGTMHGSVRITNSLVFGNCAWEAGDEFLVSLFSHITVECSGYRAGGILVGDGSSIDSVGRQFHDVPMYCDPRDCLGEGSAWPEFTGDYHLQDGSPYLPENNPCGVRIGALGSGCADPTPTGACCCDWGGCYIHVYERCLVEFCEFKGAGTVCDPDPCMTPVRKQSWGSLKNLFAPTPSKDSVPAR